MHELFPLCNGIELIGETTPGLLQLSVVKPEPSGRVRAELGDPGMPVDQYASQTVPYTVLHELVVGSPPSHIVVECSFELRYL